MPHKPPMLPETGFLRLSQVLLLVPLSRTSWFEGVKAGRFPKPVKLGPRIAAYRAQDIAILIERLGSPGSGDPGDDQHLDSNPLKRKIS